MPPILIKSLWPGNRRFRPLCSRPPFSILLFFAHAKAAKNTRAYLPAKLESLKSSSRRPTKLGPKHATFRRGAPSISRPGQATFLKVARSMRLSLVAVPKLTSSPGIRFTDPTPTTGIRINGSSMSYRPRCFRPGKEQLSFPRSKNWPPPLSWINSPMPWNWRPLRPHSPRLAPFEIASGPFWRKAGKRGQYQTLVPLGALSGGPRWQSIRSADGRPPTFRDADQLHSGAVVPILPAPTRCSPNSSASPREEHTRRALGE